MYICVVDNLSTFKFDHLEKKNSTVVFTVYCLMLFCLDTCVVIGWCCLCVQSRQVQRHNTQIELIFTLNCCSCGIVCCFVCAQTIPKYFFRFILRVVKLKFLLWPTTWTSKNVKRQRVEFFVFNNIASSKFVKKICSLKI